MIAYILLSLFGLMAVGATLSSGSSSSPEPAGGSDPKPVDPDPVDPDPVDPDPVDPDPVDPDPVDPDPVDPDPVDPVDPTPPVQEVDPSNGGSIAPTTLTNGISVNGARVTTLQVEDHANVDSIRILDGPEHGELTVNPDNTMALVMSWEPDFQGTTSFSYEVTYNDGSIEVIQNTVNVQDSTQDAGWGQGNFYMLETDENGDVVVETGDNHRDVYITGGDHGLSLQEIANAEGLNTNQITGDWLSDHPEYGGSEGMALNSEAGMRLWNSLNGYGSGSSSDWLLFERGYEYNDLGPDFDPHMLELSYASGEDELHPIHITAYGDGNKPVINATITVYGDDASNLAFSEIAVTGGFAILGGSNFFVSEADITNDATHNSKVGFLADGTEGITLHNSSIMDVYFDTPPDGDNQWAANDMSAGFLSGNTSGILIQGSLFDQNGWAPDYMSPGGGQPTNVFSHNVYIDYNATDVTFRDNVTMQASNNGVMVRSGGFIEDNVMIDNNNGVVFSGGEFAGSGLIGHFTLFADNLITSGGNNPSNATTVVASGVSMNGEGNVLIDNIVAHLADPNNPAEYDAKDTGNQPLNFATNPFYNDTILYNWTPSGQLENWGYDPAFDDQNTENLDTSVLNQTTIQIFTQQLLGDPNAGISDLADYLRAQASGELDDYVDADLIISFFQTGFGLSIGDRLSPEVARFVPNDLGDGIRWDNRLNWDTDDLPGSVPGDSVDLGGNHVNYGSMTSTINNLELGTGGELEVTSGRLNVTGEVSVGENGGQIDISGSGQLWIDGASDSDQLTINVTGGRFANTGDIGGNTEMNIHDGQAILATGGANYDVESGSELNIFGSDADVGFDSDDGDTAVLRLSEGGTVSFTADNNGISGIEEFRSGAMGDNPDVASGINLGLGSVEIDVSDLSGNNGSYDLMAADEIIGDLSDIRVTGLSGNQNAQLVMNYETDQLTLNLTNGNGTVSYETVGSETDMDHADANDIWAALTEGQGTYSDAAPTDVYDEDELVDMVA